MIGGSEEKIKATALRANEEQFRLVFEEAPVGMVIGIGDRAISKVNRTLCKMMGYEEDELLGRRVTDFIHPEDQEQYTPVTEKLFAGHITGFSNEKRYLRKDGGTIWARTTAKAFNGPDGRIAFALGIVEDITGGKLAQDAIERERRSLSEALRAGRHERQLLSYEIHDGLAQYIAAAGMQFQAYASLRNGVPEEAETAYRAGMELVRQAEAEARRLIRSSRPSFLDEVGLESAISQLIERRKEAGSPEIEFECTLHIESLPALVAQCLYYIVQEALTNACKYSQSEKVAVYLFQDGQDVQLEVRDWGVGFDPESVGADHFGLEGMRYRARLVDGRLTVRSATGVGTLIQAVMPISGVQGAL